MTSFDSKAIGDLVADVRRDPSPAVAHELGHELFQRFVRGDAMIGLIDDIEGAEGAMLDALTQGAAAGIVESWATLGHCYLAAIQTEGAFEGVNDMERKFPWSSKLTHQVAEDVESHEGIALRCFAEAAALGSREAALTFTALARQCEPDTQRVAITLLERFSEDDATAQTLYRQANVKTWLQEYKEAAAILHRAADRGNADAIFELHIFYAQGLGVDKDEAQEREWLLRAAALDHPRALYNIGAFHATGDKGFDFDNEKAASFYERAARAGNGRAATVLAVMHLNEDIAGASREKAIEWLNEAEELGFDPFDLLDAVGVDDPREAE